MNESTLGIIGYGEIGSEIAKRAKALGMNVIGCRRHPHKVAGETSFADEVVGMERADEVLRTADFIVLALPSMESTDNFINRERINSMKEGSYIINVGRGNSISEPALIEGLESGHVAGAALDVFKHEPLPEDHPFWRLENLILSPHQAYFSTKNAERITDLYLRNLERYKNGEPLLNVIDPKIGY